MPVMGATLMGCGCVSAQRVGRAVRLPAVPVLIVTPGALSVVGIQEFL